MLQLFFGHVKGCIASAKMLSQPSHSLKWALTHGSHYLTRVYTTPLEPIWRKEFRDFQFNPIVKSVWQDVEESKCFYIYHIYIPWMWLLKESAVKVDCQVVYYFWLCWKGRAVISWFQMTSLSSCFHAS